MSSAPRLLILLTQLPQDPASGAARSTLAIGRMLAGRGFVCRAVATSATEGAPIESLGQWLATTGLTPSRQGQIVSFNDRGVSCDILDVGLSKPRELNATDQRDLLTLLNQTLASFRPQIVLTFGGSPFERALHDRCRAVGAKLVFHLHNLGYLVHGFLDHFDLVISPSRFLANRYREEVGVESVALPVPIEPADVIAPGRHALFTTFVNPSLEKGVVFFARLAEELCTRRPDIPVLVIESRGHAGLLVRVGLEGGFDLTRHQSLMIAPPTPDPRTFWAATRTLLVPSVCEEAAGRVVAEALLNGVPPIVSDHGGLLEIAGAGGIVLPIPADITVESIHPPAPSSVEPWIKEIIQLADDEPYYQQRSAAARAESARFAPDRVADQYAQALLALI